MNTPNKQTKKTQPLLPNANMEENNPVGAELEEAFKQELNLKDKTDFNYTLLDYSNMGNFIKVYRYSVSGSTYHGMVYKYEDRMEFYDEGKKSFLEIKHSTISTPVVDNDGEPIKEDDGSIKTIKKESISRKIEKIHNSFETKEERDFYKKTIKNLKVEDLSIVKTIDPYLTVKNGTINKFDSRGIIERINKKRKEGDFPLIKYKLQNMFGECYDAFINFISFRYLYPLINPELAFCFYSKNQIGKTRFIEYFLEPIFGKDNICVNASISKIEDLKFNASFENKIFTNLNEFICSDKHVISLFRSQIQSQNIEIHYKGKEKTNNPFFNTFIVSTNEYPNFLNEEGSSNRWIVPNLLQFNQDTKPLFKLGSTLAEFKAEIPAFINYISNLTPTKPLYKDFDKINTVKNYSKFGTEVDWYVVMNKTITAINQKNSSLITRKEKGKDTGTYIKLDKESMEIINIIYNNEMCNNEKNAKHYNRGDIIKLITNLKDDRIRFFDEKRVTDEGLKKKSVICVAFVDEVNNDNEGLILDSNQETKQEISINNNNVKTVDYK